MVINLEVKLEKAEMIRYIRSKAEKNLPLDLAEKVFNILLNRGEDAEVRIKKVGFAEYQLISTDEKPNFWAVLG